ncbi:hypothetical protein RHGRI_036235 [Rhododendron griersonianum]|uniref:Uncharacterized protein n=1 Tax=Rhododendron griersonianum TaxID=479676 RepID=A0AAV6HSM5_9ERIC|nr:hypothetical protein RHGRI_036235 [Rhododendron griersonianum]
MSNNYLGGYIPVNLSRCSNLINLALDHIYLEGEIPSELRSLHKVVNLYLGNNNLTGGFPSSLGNLSSLQQLILTYNSLEGDIPDAVAQLRSLMVFEVAVNKFSGSFPASLYNLLSLIVISMALNNFSGSLRTDIGLAFPNLQALILGKNRFTGHIWSSLSNASSLEELDLNCNNFIGTIPSSFGNLQSLQLLNIYNNTLGTRGVVFANNKFEGQLTSSIANLSTQLIWFRIDGNYIHGSIPPEITNLINLEIVSMTLYFLTVEVGNLRFLTGLDVSYNKLSGEIPSALGSCLALEQLYMQGNLFQGTIPYLGNLSSLQDLDLSNNSLDGQIPLYLVNISSLQNLNLSYNNLEGEVPGGGVFTNASAIKLSSSKNLCGGIPELHFHPCPKQSKKPRKHTAHKLILAFTIFLSFLALQLQFLDIANNSFGGVLPSSVTNLSTQLTRLLIGGNGIHGKIPGEISNLINLIVLSVEGNFLTGKIPDSIGKLSSLKLLQLESNLFTGEIPISLGNNTQLLGNSFGGNIPSLSGLKNIQFLDLSHNHLSGQIPQYLAMLSSLLSLNLSFNNLEGEVPVKGVFRSPRAIHVSGNKKLCGGIQELKLQPCPIQSPEKPKKNASLTLIVVLTIVASWLALMVHRVLKAK